MIVYNKNKKVDVQVCLCLKISNFL